MMKEEIPKYKLSKILVLLYLLFNVYKRMNIISKHTSLKKTQIMSWIWISRRWLPKKLSILSKFTNSAAFTKPCMLYLIVMAYRFLLL